MGQFEIINNLKLTTTQNNQLHDSWQVYYCIVYLPGSIIVW